MRRTILVLALGAFAIVLAGTAMSSDAAKAAKPAKARYLVIVPHTAEQCLAALDEINTKGSKSLATWEFGCRADDHTAYQIVMAKSPEEARALVPESGREGARIVMLTKFTAADIKAFHEQMNAAH